jgi:hypothetical protein
VLLRYHHEPLTSSFLRVLATPGPPAAVAGRSALRALAIALIVVAMRQTHYGTVVGELVTVDQQQRKEAVCVWVILLCCCCCSRPFFCSVHLRASAPNLLPHYYCCCYRSICVRMIGLRSSSSSSSLTLSLGRRLCACGDSTRRRSGAEQRLRIFAGVACY